jgi:hypothetical protein
MPDQRPSRFERRATGRRDGYRIGPDGIDPHGEPVTTGYDEDLIGDPDYRRGASEGRSERIDEQLAARAEAGDE